MKILICDDHQIVRDGLKKILQQLPDITIEEVGDVKEALNILKNNTFDIILQDISLPDRSGLDVLQFVKNKSPNTNVLMLSMHPLEQYAIRALKLGASGYLTKNAAAEELIIAINTISKGEKYISKLLAANMATHLNENKHEQKHDILSGREFEIMINLANGKSLLEIGNEYFISNKTVSTYRSRIMTKMNFRKNTELTKYCLENKLI
jgi:two-component system invasion response regulator UvrY